MTKSITDPHTAAIPFRLWWGILGCGMLMGVIILVGPYSDGINFNPDLGSSYYYWQLPDPTRWTRFSAWTGYLLHQLSIWALIYSAMNSNPNYKNGLHRFNLMALVANAFFILVHIAQTKYFYDGLAQDTSIYSSFFSVTIMLFIIYIMENKRRGMFFGKPLPFMEELGKNLRRYHGYYFSWAIIYTFWYHPIEVNVGHLTGTFYTILLMLQGSLFYTRFHTNRWWTFFLEVVFSIHGFMVAYYVSQKPDNAWMFFFAGLGACMITQIYGVPLKKIQRHLLMGVSFLIIGYYSVFIDSNPTDLTRVILLRYVVIIALAIILWGMMKALITLNRARVKG